MKKYKLLKDLPLYPAGTICEIRKQDDSLYFDGSESVVKVEVDSLVEIMSIVELRAIRDEGKFSEWFEEVEDSKVWEPKEDEYFYCLDTEGCYGVHRNYKSIVEDGMFEIGNCFKTAEEAEKAVEKLKALRRLREKGLRLKSWEANGSHITIQASIPDISCSRQDVTDLNLLFKEED